MLKNIRDIFKVAIALSTLVGYVSFPTRSYSEENKATFQSFAATRASPRLTVSPLVLNGGSTITLVSPENWSGISKRISSTLQSTHKNFSKLFGEIPALKATIRLLDDEVFYSSTNAPRWTNALFYRGEILIPIGAGKKIDEEDLLRAVRHEYTHALINSLSGARCPGWIDEGLAQWSEGSENPALLPALIKWLSLRPPVPLSLLQGGFTKLDSSMVPAAYAQSLYSVNLMIGSFGYDKFRAYFDLLRQGTDRAQAFEESFGFNADSFEKGLGELLRSWALGQAEPKT